MVPQNSNQALPDDAMIWRYVDFPKFVSMLSSSSLWFARLGTFDDYFEGTLSVPAMLTALGGPPGMPKSPTRAYFEGLFRIHSALSNLTRMYIFVSCWNLSEGESHALWRIYGENGIAIQSTVGRLRAALPAGYTPEIKIGSVSYVDDPESEETDKYGLDKPVLTKRSIYDYEREIRTYIVDIPLDRSVEEYMKLLRSEELKSGLPISVNLNQLIENVYVAPYRPRWFVSLVASVLEKYEMPHLVPRSSTVEERPAFYRDPTLIDIRDVEKDVRSYLQRRMSQRSQ